MPADTPAPPNRIAVADYQGPAEWQIFQQSEGAAALSLSGRLAIPATEPSPEAFFPIVRVVCEDSSRPVTEATGWRRADRFDASTGHFAHRIADLPEGGLYRLEIGAACNPRFEYLKIVHVVHALGVGDLWVLAGQSNSAGIGSGLAADPPELGVHLLANSERWKLAMHPLNDPTDSFHPNVEGRALHSPNLAFAKGLKRELGYPVGLIQTALGGSPLSLWNPAEDGRLFRNLLHCIRLAGGRVRGVLWYQGGSDAAPEPAATYAKRFAHFVRSLREELGQPELPVITTQINRVWDNQAPEAMLGWSLIRDIQRRLARDLEGVAVVPALGLPLCDAIHNSAAGNLELGQRYATTALGMVYGRKVAWRYPEPRGIRRSGERSIEIVFEHVASHLEMITAHPCDFRVEDESGVLEIVGWAIDANDRLTLTLHRPLGANAKVSNGVGTRPDPSLYDFSEHRPALAFFELPVA